MEVSEQEILTERDREVIWRFNGKNSLNFMKNINLHFQKAQQTPSRINSNPHPDTSESNWWKTKNFERRQSDSLHIRDLNKIISSETTETKRMKWYIESAESKNKTKNKNLSTISRKAILQERRRN